MSETNQETLDMWAELNYRKKLDELRDLSLELAVAWSQFDRRGEEYWIARYSKWVDNFHSITRVFPNFVEPGDIEEVNNFIDKTRAFKTELEDK